MKKEHELSVLGTSVKIELTGEQVLLFISSLEYARKALHDEWGKGSESAYPQHDLVGKMILFGIHERKFSHSEYLKEIDKINYIILEACLSLHCALEERTNK